MRESVLRDYFLGHVDETRLIEDLSGSAITTAKNRTSYHIIDDLEGEFEVKAIDIVRLCDDFLDGKLRAEHLEFVAFALIASDYFTWGNDGEVTEDSSLAETIHSWSSPEINYPLVPKTIAKFRHWLETGENLFTRDDIAK